MTDMAERAEATRQNIRMRLRRMGDRDIFSSHHLEWHGLRVVYYPTSDTFNWFAPDAPRDITRSLRKQAVLDYIATRLGETA